MLLLCSWRQVPGDCSTVQPVAVLQGHSHPVLALLSGLTGRCSNWHCTAHHPAHCSTASKPPYVQGMSSPCHHPLSGASGSMWASGVIFTAVLAWHTYVDNVRHPKCHDPHLTCHPRAMPRTCEATAAAPACLPPCNSVALLSHCTQPTTHRHTFSPKKPTLPVAAAVPATHTAPEPSSSSSSSGSYLLSLDAEGWVGLWDTSTWVCLDLSRAAPLPSGCTPTLLAMVRGGGVSVCVCGGGS